jgi:hypothetical protein
VNGVSRAQTEDTEAHSQGFGFSVRNFAKMPSFTDATIRFARAAGSRPVKI